MREGDTGIGDMAGGGGGIDPGRAYSPRSLAAAAGVSVAYLYRVIGAGELTHRRSRPGARRGRITILGRWWLDYLQRCQRGGDGGEREQEGEVIPPRSARSPRSPSPRRRQPSSAADPFQLARAAARGE